MSASFVLKYVFFPKSHDLKVSLAFNLLTLTGTQPLSTFHFWQILKMAAPHQPSFLVTLVDGQQGTDVPSLILSLSTSFLSLLAYFD